MLARNQTPFAAIGFEQIHRDGPPMAVVSVRGCFNLYPDGKLEVIPKPPLVLADEYDGHPHNTPLLRASDLIPFKPFADVTVLANAYAPEGKPAKNWLVEVSIEKAVNYALRVHAPRVWTWDRDGLLGNWQLRYVEKGATEIPIDYRYTFGGVPVGDATVRATPDERNPIGRGPMMKGVSVKRDIDYPAAQIENPKMPLEDPYQDSLEPEGFAPIPVWWAWRGRYTGTCDDAWIKERAPHHPKDFDYRLYQVAHPKLIMPGYLRGNEEVQLRHLTRGIDLLKFRLPGMSPWVEYHWTDRRQVNARLNCDGLHIDLRTGPPWRLDLTWRSWVVACPRFMKIDLYHATLAETAHLPHSDENGLSEADEQASNTNSGKT